MNKQQYFKFFEDCQRKELEITKSKNADYTGATSNPFANFERVSGLYPFITTEMGFLTRMTDKMSRIGSFVEAGQLQVKDESVEDTLLDLAIYCKLFLGYIRSKSLQEVACIDEKTGAVEYVTRHTDDPKITKTMYRVVNDYTGEIRDDFKSVEFANVFADSYQKTTGAPHTVLTVQIPV